MNRYESIFIARQDISPAQVETLTKNYVGVLQEQNASVSKTEYAGLIELAYIIKKNRKGHYVLMNVEASPQAIAEMERRMRLDEDILRYLTVSVEEHEEGPSALTQHARFQSQRSTYRPRDEDDRSSARKFSGSKSNESGKAQDNSTPDQED